MSAITSIFGGGGDSAGPAPTRYNTWQPSNTTGQDTNFNNAVNQNLGMGNAAAPGWQQYLSQLTNNPYQAGAQNASNTAGQAYTDAGNNAISAANGLYGASNTLLNNSFDPQNQIYNTQHQNNTDATNASLAARGLNTSAVGADAANQSDVNFNQAWQGNLLNRQGTGVAGAGSGYGAANNLQLSGAGGLNAGGQAPLQTYNSGVSTLGQGLTGYNAGVNSTNQSALSDIMGYLGLGASQSNAQGNFDQQYWQDQMNYQQTQNDQNNNLWGAAGNLGGNLLNSQLTSNSPAWLSALAL